MSSAGGTGGVVFGYDFCNCGVQIEKEVIFKFSGNASKFGVVCLSMVNYLVQEGEEPVSNAAK